MQGDPVKYELWGLGIGVSLTLVCAVLIVLANGGSRNLALGLGALVGAVVVFSLQLFFELQGSTTTEDVFIEAVVDYQANSIRSVQPHPHTSMNVFVEGEASGVVAAMSPPLGQDDAPRAVRDLAVVSVLAFLFGEQPDWQLNSATYKWRGGEAFSWRGMSKPSDCTSFTLENVREKLSKAGNMFAVALSGTFPDKLCLPPNSTFDVTANSVTIKNRVCQVTIAFIEPFFSMSSTDPDNQARGEVPTLPNGSPRYRTVLLGGTTTTEFLPLRAQARNLSKYQAWVTRISERLKKRLGNN